MKHWDAEGMEGLECGSKGRRRYSGMIPRLFWININRRI